MKTSLRAIRLSFPIGLLLTTLIPLLSCFAQGSAFTYQGRLSDGGLAASGSYDLRFTIYDLASGGNAVAGPLTNSATAVNGGLFTTTLDFGAGVFTGAYLSRGGVWTDLSDRNAKENFKSVEPGEVLKRVASLPIAEWNYKAEDDSVRHIGPVAQDFHAAFGIGADDKHLAALDANGVALAAIQGLNQKLEEEKQSLRGQLKAKDSQLEALEKRLTELEKLLSP